MKFVLCVLVIMLPTIALGILNLSDQEIENLGKKIWHNECGNSTEKLVWWNTGESCASLGIGHFIWYPQECKQRFTQTFPLFITYIQNHGISVPAWLKQDYCPWNSRDQFLRTLHDPAMDELKTLLISTINLQTRFIIDNFMQQWNSITLKNNQKRTILQRFEKLASFYEGIYALLDYANFKGFGVNIHERYNGQGWGLIQVLESMEFSSDKKALLRSFSQEAQKLLGKRVQNAPKDKPEDQWLPGWLARVRSYQVL